MIIKADPLFISERLLLGKMSIDTLLENIVAVSFLPLILFCWSRYRHYCNFLLPHTYYTYYSLNIANRVNIISG